MKIFISGVTLLELVIVTLVFSLFMFGVYTTIDVGMKSWQMGETKSNIYQKAMIAMNNIIRDFTGSNWITAQIENYGTPETVNEYICFETSLDTVTNTYDVENGKPKWQGYIIYYIYPRVTLSPSTEKRDLYRRFKPRINKDVNPFPLEDILLYIDKKSKATNENLRLIAKDIYGIDFDQKGVSLFITITLKTKIRKEASVMFSTGGNDNIGTELVKMTNSVIPRN
ncbi:MAG TPA: hypothetical protein PL110_12370 [Candidatus Eremiobacteraeota bacterium]|nr:hypothetical protein [Candidatus Eremiobacteraeota bacterium]